jgi:hypothetical protein
MGKKRDKRRDEEVAKIQAEERARIVAERGELPYEEMQTLLGERLERRLGAEGFQEAGERARRKGPLDQRYRRLKKKLQDLVNDVIAENAHRATTGEEPYRLDKEGILAGIPDLPPEQRDEIRAILDQADLPS